MSRRCQAGLVGITEEAANDLVLLWLVLLGLVFGLGMLAAVELLAILSGS